MQKNNRKADENFLKEKFRFSLAGLSLVSLLVLLPVFQFLNANPFFHFRFGMDKTLFAMIVLCFGLAPALCLLAFAWFAIGKSRDAFYSRIILGASLFLFLSHLYSTALHELAPILKASIVLAVLAIGTLALVKTSRELI